jgi:hypothetical protein
MKELAKSVYLWRFEIAQEFHGAGRAAYEPCECGSGSWIGVAPRRAFQSQVHIVYPNLLGLDLDTISVTEDDALPGIERQELGPSQIPSSDNICAWWAPAISLHHAVSFFHK